MFNNLAEISCTLRLEADSWCTTSSMRTHKVSRSCFCPPPTTGSSSSVRSCSSMAMSFFRLTERRNFRQCCLNSCVTVSCTAPSNNPSPLTVLQRSEIVKAAYEPTDEECKWTADAEEELTVSKQVLVTYKTPACPSSHFAPEWMVVSRVVHIDSCCNQWRWSSSCKLANAACTLQARS